MHARVARVPMSESFCTQQEVSTERKEAAYEAADAALSQSGTASGQLTL